MKRSLIIIAALALLGTTSMFAQVSASDQITVTATNQGIFTFNIDLATYAFGTVNPNGTANVGGTESLTGVRGATSSVYTTGAGGPNFTVASAPSRTVRIYNNSLLANHSGVLAAGSLAMRIPSVPSGTACAGPVAFTASGDGGAAACAGGNLAHSVTVGNGANDVDGDLELQLTVADTDLTGLTTWTVTVTATGI